MPTQEEDQNEKDAPPAWLSADWSAVPEAVPYANLTNPQTLNLYAMVSDDPESFADLDGHEGGLCYGCGPDGTTPTPLSADFPRSTMSETEKQIDTGIIEIASAVATGGASAEAQGLASAIVGGLTSAGMLVSGTMRLVGTAAGEKPEKVEQAANTATNLTNPVGYLVTVGTKDVKAGAVATDVATAATAAAKPSEAMKDPAGTFLTLGNLAKDIKSGYGTVKNWLTTPAPPKSPPPPPPPPSGPTVVRPGGLNTKQAGGPAKTVTQSTGGAS